MAPQGHLAHLAKLSLELPDLAEELQASQAAVGLGHKVVKFFLQLTIQPLSQLHTGPGGWEERGHQCQVLPGEHKVEESRSLPQLLTPALQAPGHLPKPWSK